MGWAWANHGDGTHDAGGATNGTNQIGELCAVLQALRAHHDAPEMIIETDSQYAINCSSTWVRGWKKNGWKNAAKKPVKNVQLIKAIDAEISGRPGSVKFVWVKGHAGNEFNEIVDDLARGFAGDAQSGKKQGYLPLEGWQALLSSDYRKGLKIPAEVQAALDGTSAPTLTASEKPAQHTQVGETSTNSAPSPHGSAANATESVDSTDTADSAVSSASTGWRIDPNQPALFDLDSPEPKKSKEPRTAVEDDPLQGSLF
jgi:ribonuclease HI